MIPRGPRKAEFAALFSTERNVLSLWVFFLPAIVALGGSRLISRVEVGPVFFLDLLLIISSFIAFAAIIGRGHLDKVDIALVVVFSVLPVFAVLVSDFLSPSELFLRDLYPYLSLGFGGIVALTVRRMNWSEQRAIAAWLVLALAVHWVWISVYHISGSDLVFQEGGSPWLRPDIDGALIGAVLIVGIFYAVQGRQMVRIGIGIASTIIILQVSSFGSRAAVVATVLGGVWAVGVLLLGNHQSRRTRFAKFSVASGILLFGLLISLFSVQDFRERMKAGADVVEISLIAEKERQPTLDSGLSREEGVKTSYESGAGPALARLRSWELVLTKTASESKTFLVGSGLGSSFLKDSGAAAELLGVHAAEAENASRHSHNMFVGLAGLLGFPAALYLLLLIAFAQRIASQRAPNESTLLRAVSLTVLNVLTVTSLFGVIWEGPYGAVPMSFTIGILFGLYARRLKMPPVPAGEGSGFISRLRHSV